MDRRVSLAAAFTITLALIAAMPSEARAVLVDSSTSATFSFDVNPQGPGPFDTVNIVVQFASTNRLDPGEGILFSLSDTLGGPVVGTQSVVGSAGGDTVVDTLFLINPPAFADGTGFVAISATGGSSSFDITFARIGLGQPNGVVTICCTGQLFLVPEPATLALVSIGLAGLGFSRRKRATR